MLAIEVAAFLLLLLWVTSAILFFGVFPYWEKKFRTEARRREIEIRKARRPNISLTHAVWEGGTRIILFGLPGLYVVDGLFLRIGLLYSPSLSFFSPFDSFLQLAGVLLSSLGILLSASAGRTISEHVYAKAEEERKMITTGIHAYIRHPFYLSFIVIPLGLVLITLNYFSILLLIPLLFFTDGEIERWTGKRRLTFFTTAIHYEEQYLIGRFGKDYEEYMKKTGKFFLKIRR